MRVTLTVLAGYGTVHSDITVMYDISVTVQLTHGMFDRSNDFALSQHPHPEVPALAGLEGWAASLLSMLRGIAEEVHLSMTSESVCKNT